MGQLGLTLQTTTALGGSFTAHASQRRCRARGRAAQRSSAISVTATSV